MSILEIPAGYACGLRNPQSAKILALLTADNRSTQVAIFYYDRFLMDHRKAEKNEKESNGK